MYETEGKTEEIVFRLEMACVCVYVCVLVFFRPEDILAGRCIFKELSEGEDAVKMRWFGGENRVSVGVRVGSRS